VLHWLDAATGDFVARAEVGSQVSRSQRVESKGIALKKRVSYMPIVAGGMVLAFTDNGVLSAYSAPLPESVASAEPPAAAAPVAAVAAEPSR
jgi:hypothetical protein